MAFYVFPLKIVKVLMGEASLPIYIVLISKRTVQKAYSTEISSFDIYIAVCESQFLQEIS